MRYIMMFIACITVFTVQAQTNDREPINIYGNYSTMPGEVERIIADANLIEKLAELPNGDRIYWAAGLPCEKVNDNTLPRVKQYPGGEALLIKSNRCGWALLQINDNPQYQMQAIKITANWQIEITFVKWTSHPGLTVADGEQIYSLFDLKTEQFIFQSEQDKQKVLGRAVYPITHYNQN